MRRTQNRVSWDRVDILWIGMIRKGSESPIIAMLMSLLPNLRRLRLTRLDDSLLLICPKLRLRRDAATFTTTFQDGDAGVASNMEKIKEVLVTPRNEHVRAPRLTLATVSPLLGLPALRTLSLEHVSDLGNIPEVRLPPCFGGVCSLETLILQNSHISIRNLRTFLRPVPALKSFSYSQTQGLCPELRSYADLIDVLGKKFGHTLEELSLGLPYTIFGYRGIPPGIKKFKVLRKLSFSNDEHSQYRDLVCEKGHPGREGIAHLFNEILPPSIEEFELKVQMRHDGSLRKMLRSVRAIRRPWPLPGLRKVSIRGNEKDQPFMWEGSERLSFQKSVQEYIQTGHLRLVEGRIACHT